MDDPTYLKWTGTNASGEKLVDEVNRIDQQRLNHRTRDYASGDVESSNRVTMVEEGFTVLGRLLKLDTITNRLILGPGDTIQRTEEGWEIVT